HPEADAVLGVPAYRTITDVRARTDGPVDLAVIAVPAESVLDVVHECAAAGVRGLVVVSGGFAETGAGGLGGARALVGAARGTGRRTAGPPWSASAWRAWGTPASSPGSPAGRHGASRSWSSARAPRRSASRPGTPCGRAGRPRRRSTRCCGRAGASGWARCRS